MEQVRVQQQIPALKPRAVTGFPRPKQAEALPFTSPEAQRLARESAALTTAPVMGKQPYSEGLFEQRVKYEPGVSYGEMGKPLTAETDAIAQFLNTNQQCELSEQDIKTFIDISRRLVGTGINLTAMARTAYLADLIDEDIYSGIGRVADMAFSPETSGTKPETIENIEPSLLWAISTRACKNLPQLNVALQEMLDGDFGVGLNMPLPSTEYQGTEEEKAQINVALGYFFSTHPKCARYQNLIRPKIIQFLNLVDNKNLRGVDLFSLIRTLGIEGYIRPMLRKRGYRVADMTLSPATRGIEEQTKNVIKYGLLWYLLSTYCLQMDTIVQWMTNVLSGAIQQKYTQQITMEPIEPKKEGTF
jgi:hypothetical protein